MILKAANTLLSKDHLPGKYGKGFYMMVVQYLIACLLAFAICVLFGRYYVAWLKKKKATQPLKDEVAEKIYVEVNEKADTNS